MRIPDEPTVAAPASFARDTPDGVVLSILAAPRAGRDEIAGAQGDSLRVRLAAPPVDGAANEALVAFIARVLDVPRSRVELLRGASSRRKTILVRGCAAELALPLLSRARQRDREKL